MSTRSAERPAPAGTDWPTDEVLASSPRVRRDILYTQVPEGVLFHDANTGFRVHGKTAYRFATLIVPFLDGRLTVADLCADLGDPQRAMVLDLVRSLYRRGFARAVTPADPARMPSLGDNVRRRFEAQIAYVDHHVDDSEQRFGRFRDTRVAILGDDEIARWAALSLLRNGAASIGVDPAILDGYGELEGEARELRADGCAVDLHTHSGTGVTAIWSDHHQYDVVVVTPGDQGVRHLLGLLEAGVPAGRTVLPALRLGDHLAIGPRLQTATAGCWMCAVLRLGANGEPGAAADLWSGLAGYQPPGRRPGGPLAAMAGNLLGYEIFRFTTGALPAETDGQVIVQDLDSLDVVVEPLLPHPGCRLCGPSQPAAPTDATSVSEPSFTPHLGQPLPEPGGPEAELLLATLRERSVLVAPRLGTFAAFDDDLLSQTPLRVSSVDLAVGHGRRRRIAAFDVHNVVGARLAAVSAAAAVYADHVIPPTGVLTDEAAAAATERIPGALPASLSTRSGLDPDGRVSAWVPATSMATGSAVLVPAAAVAPYSRHNDLRVFVPGSAGLGVDSSPDRARGAGLLSALAHDALSAAMRGHAPLPRVALAGQDDDPVLTFLTRTSHNLGVEVDLIELGAADELPVPVLMARCLDPAEGNSLWTVAAATSWRAAAVAALRDLLGRVQLTTSLPQGETVDTGDPLVTDLDAFSLTATGEVGARLELARSLPQALARLRADGVEPLVVDRGAADLAAAGLSVARVLIHRYADVR